MELFGDEIEQLSLFDPLTGARIAKLARYTVYPKTHYVTSQTVLKGAIGLIKDELRERLAQLRAAGKELEAQRLDQRTRFDLEMMAELGYCSGIENYSRYLSGRPAGSPPPTLLDYLPSNALLFIDESHVTVPQVGGMYKGDRSRKETLVEYGFRLPSAMDNRPLKFEEFEGLMPQTVFISATPGTYEMNHSGQIVEQVVRPTGLVDPLVEVRPARSQVDDLIGEIHATVSKGFRVLVTTLTKRMSEDLTDYLNDLGIRVRYLHADIDTVERVEIIRDLRAGSFDVLIGINLLREGLDMPEVALVAILDADKEGFLRSDRSLIQTIGRAARNLQGRAILYADRITGSMQRAMEETERRRNKQIEFNTANGITPKGIIKPVADLIEGVYARRPGAPKARAAENKGEYNTPTDALGLARSIKRLEQEMYEHSKNLEFEKAARTRDELRRLEQLLLGVDPSMSGKPRARAS